MKGLVLEGGGVKGAYQIGAFYAFRDCGIKFDGFVGTSIGAINAVMLASDKVRELLGLWYNIDPGDLFGFDVRFVELFNDKKLDINGLKGALQTLKSIIKNIGLDNTKLLELIKKEVNYDDLMKSHKDFGLVTVKISKKGLEPVYIYKEDIDNQDHLIEYLMASCYLPIFKEKRMIDNHYYIDGGFYDNSPIKLLKDKGYDQIYVINIKGIGINRNLQSNNNVTTISPSRDNGAILELDRNVVKDNIMMGYYDTLRVIKNLDGYKYCFKRKSSLFYKMILRKVDKRLQNRVRNFFDTKDNREVIIKSLEYILEKENFSYYNIYNPLRIIKILRRTNNKHFIYRFVRKLKFL